MDEQELLKERFKSAVSSTVKAISENFDIQIKFCSNIDSKKNSLNLPEVANLKKLQDFTNLRAFADSEALKLKYTNSFFVFIPLPNIYPLIFVNRINTYFIIF